MGKPSRQNNLDISMAAPKRTFMLFAASLGLVASLGFAPFPWAGRAQGDKPAGFVGMSTCANCHDKLVPLFRNTPHDQGENSCESCHGPGKAHVDGDGDKSKIHNLKDRSARETSATCLECHAKGNQKHWAGSMHDSRKIGCTQCHNVHPDGKAPKALLAKPQFELCTSCHLQRKAALLRSGHMPMREGRMNCNTCHNPHGTPYDKNLLQASVNQNCYSCHAEKRGPFLFEHPPVRENCLNCHDPHGSLHDNLLKLKQPILCQQCHIGTRHPGQLHVNDRYSFAQGCVNCHPKIHGSIHPAGNRFWR